MNNNVFKETHNALYNLFISQLCMTGGYKPIYISTNKLTMQPQFYPNRDDQNLDAPVFYQEGHHKWHANQEDADLYRIKDYKLIVIRQLHHINGR